MKSILNLHGIIPSSGVNGPGLRCVVFFQGCVRGCEGCFNPGTHDLGMKKSMTVEEVLRSIPSGIEGITISGGEPFLQLHGLLSLLGAIRSETGLSVMVYTGYTLTEIEAKSEMSRVLPLVDVLVAGPYDESLPEKTLLARGSTNQTIHFLSSRYTMADLYLPGRIEVTIGRDGTMTGTGFARLQHLMGMP